MGLLREPGPGRGCAGSKPGGSRDRDPFDQLPEGHRYFAYQSRVNAGGSPTEEVIRRHRAEFGAEYRRELPEEPGGRRSQR